MEGASVVLVDGQGKNAPMHGVIASRFSIAASRYRSGCHQPLYSSGSWLGSITNGHAMMSPLGFSSLSPVKLSATAPERFPPAEPPMTIFLDGEAEKEDALACIWNGLVNC